MNVLRRPCTKLIQMSFELNRIPATRPALSKLTSLNSGYVCSSHTRNIFASSSVSTENEDGPIKRFLKKFTNIDNTKARLQVSGYTMYAGVVDNVKYSEIFSKFNLPNTFNSWFLITEVHIWMLMVRSMAEGPEKGQDGMFLRNCIVEAMWSDVNKRARQLNSGNLSELRKQIETLSDSFRAALITYDEGLMDDDKVLAAALWRRFFEMNCNNYVHLETMVKFVRQQTKQLDSLSRQDFVIKPNVQWINITDL
ncbi:ubiquinol-cytochrome-c reductase complex assembly factor 1-like [Bradysia coprophila]|uniref:ubiquinol-cytochrome-c reductase complex assembly factor 1-like n=1 Tax=Bradysia coprophila TaxID=38358 RepID=UPI00187DBA01|nr:ubiquinol-cytochrome-c reductase complex assembly factor 1-like [Bradysia coprophila]